MRHIQDNSGLAVEAGDKIKDDGLVVGLALERLDPAPHIKLLHIDHNITKRSITTARSTSASISPGQSPCSSLPRRTTPSRTPAARTSTCFRKLHYEICTSAAHRRGPFLRIHVVGRVGPSFQLFVLLVELSQKFGALVGYLEAGGGRRLLHLGRLDYDLGLHRHLGVLVLHYHHLRLLRKHQGDPGSGGSRGRRVSVASASVGWQGGYEVVDSVAEAGYFRKQTAEVHPLVNRPEFRHSHLLLLFLFLLLLLLLVLLFFLILILILVLVLVLVFILILLTIFILLLIFLFVAFLIILLFLLLSGVFLLVTHLTE